MPNSPTPTPSPGPGEPLVRRPAPGVLVLGAIPFAALCFTVPLWDRATPVVLGLPFNVFWLLAWILATPGIMAVALRWERRR